MRKIEQNICAIGSKNSKVKTMSQGSLEISR